MALVDFNKLTIAQAQAGLFELCHSPQWSAKVASAMPFASEEEAIRQAEEIFDQLPATEIIQAMRQHSKLGAPASDVLSKTEQATLISSQESLTELLNLNEEYERKFGFTYLAFAMGKTAGELSILAKERMNNDLATEFFTVRSELKKITIHRFARWLAADAQTLSLSTHVLNAVNGMPAQGVTVQLLSSNHHLITTGTTNEDGRITDFTNAHALRGQVFHLTFAVGEYFAQHHTEAFYPEITISFRVSAPEQHYHVPILLSPYSFTTYRGS